MSKGLTNKEVEILEQIRLETLKRMHEAIRKNKGIRLDKEELETLEHLIYKELLEYNTII